MQNKRFDYFVMDVDGTLTDGRIILGQDGAEYKSFYVKDGYGIANLLPVMGIEPVVVTGRQSEIVTRRCRELGIRRCYQNVADKKKLMDALFADSLNRVLYMGDDLNDYDAMRYIRSGGGMIACPADAADEIKEISDYISKKKGGFGAVRDCICHIKMLYYNKIEVGGSRT